MKVSIIIPVVRYHKYLNLVELIHQNAGIPKEDYEIVASLDIKGIGCPKMVKKLTDRTKYKLVCFLGDDTKPQKDFLKNAIEVMKLFEDSWGLVGFNDGTGRALPTHWLAHKNLLPYLNGEFFHTGYWHCYSDNELLQICNGINRFNMAEDAVVLHDHPLLNGSKTDKHYNKVYSREYMEHDRNLFLKRGKKWL